MLISRPIRWLLLVLLVVVPTAIITRQAVVQDTPSTGTGGSAWSTLGGDPARTSAVAGPGPEADPAVRWHFTYTGGDGQLVGSVLVADGAVFLGGGEGQPVFALDQATGEVRWSADVGYVVGDDEIGAFTASVDGETLYVTGSEGQAQCDCMPPAALYALDVATGQERWRVSFPGESSLSLPTVAGGQVVATLLEDEESIVAFDAATGDERWRVPLGADVGVNGPIAVADGAVYVPAIRYRLGGLVLALDAATGAERWRAETAGYVRTGPTVLGGTLYLVTETEGQGAATLVALDAATGGERWGATIGEDVDGGVSSGHITATSALIYVDFFGFLSRMDAVGMSRVLALDPASGAEVWRRDGLASAVVAGDLLYAGAAVGESGRAGRVVALDAATGTERWRLDGPNGVRAVADGMLIAVGGNEVWGIVESTGADQPAPNEVTADVPLDADQDAEELPPGEEDAFSGAMGPTISLVSPDGSDLRIIGEGSNPVWSPDGATLAYEGYNDAGETDVFVADADGANARSLVAVPDYDVHPTWSPDGSRIAFVNGNGDVLYVVNADGTGLLRLSDLGGGGPLGDPFFQRPAWSPDGTRIAFAAGLGDGVEIWVIDADGTDLTQLTVSATVSAPAGDEAFRTSIVALVCPGDVLEVGKPVEMIPDGDPATHVAAGCRRAAAGEASFAVLGFRDETAEPWPLARGETDAAGVVTLEGRLLEGGGTYAVMQVHGPDGSFGISDQIEPPFAGVYLFLMGDSGGMPPMISIDEDVPEFDEVSPLPPEGEELPPEAEEPLPEGANVDPFLEDDAPPLPQPDKEPPFLQGKKEIATGPAWSPDGAWIAYVTLVPGDDGGVSDGAVWLMRPDGTGRTRVTDVRPEETAPVWSPDGTRLLFGSGWSETQVPDLYVVEVAGPTVAQVTTTDTPEYGAVWSPDGTRIVYAVIGPAGMDLVVADADGSGATTIGGPDTEEGSPAWSPDGTTIVFTAHPPFQSSGD